MRIIAHIDADAFFAAVEERDNPRIQGLPIVVGSDPMEGKGRGVVSTANYKAREYGIRSAVPISKAWQYSQKAKNAGKPEAVFLPVDMKNYTETSSRIMKIIRQYSKITEQASIDEMYAELTHAGNFEKAEKICKEIKKETWKKEKLTVLSIGLASSKLVAKIASDMQKPDGLTIVRPEQAEMFLEALPIRKIPGIGPKTEQYLNRLKVFSVKDLKKYTEEKLKELLGKWGEELYYKIRGVDDSPVTEEYDIKSIGEQETFLIDTLNFSEVIGKLEVLCGGIFCSFQKSGFKSFRTIVITVRFADFSTKTRSHTLLKPSWEMGIFKVEAIRLLMPFFDRRENPQRKLIRLVGVRIEKLE